MTAARMAARIGLIGGIGPEATIDYYRRLIEAWRSRNGEGYPALLIDILDLDRVLQLIANDRKTLVDYVADSASRLKAGGADLVVITSNTTHLVFDEVSRRTQVPMVSSVEVCAAETARRGLKRPLLLGTRFTMEASLYPDVFARYGLEVLTPLAGDRDWVHDKYMSELVRGHFHSTTRDAFGSLVGRLRRELLADAVILGGTELPILLRTATVGGLPVLDTTTIHVDAIIKRVSEMS